MKSWTKQVGANSYQFRTATVRDRARGTNLQTIHANVRWDDDGVIETDLRFSASLDIREGDRLMVVSQTGGLQKKQGAWVLITTTRANTYIPYSNTVPLPRITVTAIWDEAVATLIWFGLILAAAAASWNQVGPLMSVPVLIAGAMWFGFKTRKRILFMRRWRSAIADEQQLFAGASALLGEWARDIRRTDEALVQAGAEDSWWVALGVGQDASLSEITSAKRKLMSEYHPDKWMALPPKLIAEAERQAQLINAAFECAKRTRNNG